MNHLDERLAPLDGIAAVILWVARYGLVPKEWH